MNSIHPSIRDHPLLRIRGQGIAGVSNSELLFDLIYVFAVTQLSHYLLHNLSWSGFAREMVLWFGVWLVWQHTTWLTNWFNPDKRSIRLFMFAMMVAGLVLAAAIPEAYADRGKIFAFTYVGVQVGRSLFVLILLGNKHPLAANYRRILGWMLISGVFWISGGFAEGHARLVLWGIGALADYISPMIGFYLPILGRSNPSEEWTVDGHHLAERAQLFVMIAFGETILMSGVSLSEIGIWDPAVLAAALVSFAGSLAMWWIYFDKSSAAGAEKIHKSENQGWLGLKYHLIHVILVGALIVCAVGNELVVNHPHGEIGPQAVLTLLVGPMIYLGANMIYKRIVGSGWLASHAAGIFFLGILIPFHPHLNLLGLNAAASMIIILIIVFDTLAPGKAKETA